LCAVLILFSAGCTAGEPEPAGGSYPASADGARQLVTELRTKDPAAILKDLAPTAEDCQAVFEGDAAAKATAYYAKQFAKTSPGPMAKPDQTELELWAATSEELKANTGNSAHFPGAYRSAAPALKPGLTLYSWKYVVPGGNLGMAYDGLVHVGSRWVWLPKPWNAVES